MSASFDCIVVGSGISGAQAAQTLLEAGRDVLMLDVGNDDTHYRPLVPDDDFVSTRQNDAQQHRYFLGDHFEGVPWGSARHTLTPPRQFITQDVDRLLPHVAEHFSPMESLAYGGLGNGWGAGCAAYADVELRAMGLDPDDLKTAYPEVARRIGISAADDDVQRFCLNGLPTTSCQPAMQLDSSMRALQRAYERKRTRLNRDRLFLGQPPLAVLTEPQASRLATRYHDMEFWTDSGQAVYRPRVTVDQLRRHPRFTYRAGHLVTRFAEAEDGAHVVVEALADGARVHLVARRLLLSTGTLGTARLVLRSRPEAKRLPILTNTYALAPCLHLRQLGKPQDRHKTGMGQLVMYHDVDGTGLGPRLLSLYTYRSLLLFKLIKEVPFDLRCGTRLMQRLAPSLLIASINHPDEPSPGKFLELEPDADSPTGDRLRIHYQLPAEQKARNAASEKVMLRAMRRLGAYPLKRQELAPGSSVHYSGCLPLSRDERPLHLGADGRLGGTRRVHVADGSGFAYLPSNGLTFSIMAFAHRVAQQVAALPG